MKYRIYPNAQQRSKLAVQFGHARFVYNATLAVRKKHYKETGKGLSKSVSIKRIVSLKADVDTEFLKEADSQVLQQKAIDLDRAYVNFFEKRARYPKFKKKHGKQSIRYPQRAKVHGNCIYLPKVGYVKIKLHRPLVGTQKSVTVSKTKTGKYFASIVCEMETEQPEHHGTSVGIDLGLKDFAIISDGTKIDHPKLLRKLEREVRLANKSLHRKKKGSNNRNKARVRLAKKYEKLANAREDFQHKLSASLTDQHAFIGVETLKIKNMMKSRRLSKAIGDSGWYEFVRQLKYKAHPKGGYVFQIDTFVPSSKTCCNCKHIFKELQLSDRVWQCEKCGTTLDRDINAAQNILNYATAGAAES